MLRAPSRTEPGLRPPELPELPQAEELRAEVLGAGQPAAVEAGRLVGGPAPTPDGASPSLAEPAPTRRLTRDARRTPRLQAVRVEERARDQPRTASAPVPAQGAARGRGRA